MYVLVCMITSVPKVAYTIGTRLNLVNEVCDLGVLIDVHLSVKSQQRQTRTVINDTSHIID